MVCGDCKKQVHRVRVIDGLDYCLRCRPLYAPDISFKLSGNPFKTDETEAYKRDLEMRYVPPGQTQWEHWKPGARTYI